MTDVELFAACLKDLLLENDSVVVPGLGSFMTRLMPASFSDLGRTINPPYRKLSFRAVENGDASLFMDKLAACLPEGTDTDAWLKSFVEGFKEALDRTKRVELENLGAMRATAQNDYFFVASEDLDIYPEGMGLAPVTIKSSTLMEPEKAPVAEVVAEPEAEPVFELEPEPETETEPAIELETEPEVTPEQEAAAETVEEPAIELESEPEPAEEPATAEAPAQIEETAPAETPAPVAAPVATPAPAPEKKRRGMKWWAVLLIVLAVILIFLILSVIFKDQLPWGDAVDNIINHILYTEEELRILNS